MPSTIFSTNDLHPPHDTLFALAFTSYILSQTRSKNISQCYIALRTPVFEAIESCSTSGEQSEDRHAGVAHFVELEIVGTEEQREQEKNVISQLEKID